MRAAKVRCATLEDDHSRILSTYVIHGWDENKS